MNHRILTLIAGLALPVAAADFFTPLGTEQTVATSITTPGRQAPIVGTDSTNNVDQNRAWSYWAVAGYGRYYGLMPAHMSARLAGAPPSYLVGDYDGDGCQDVLIVSRDSGQSSLVMGSPDGTLTANPTGIPAMYATKRTDGLIGPVRQAPERDGINLYSPITGTGAASQTTVGNWQLRTGDFNGDGLTDIVAQAVYENSLHILLSRVDANGVQSFADPIQVPKPAIVTSWQGHNASTNQFNFEALTEVEVADFDGDGKSDLMVRVLCPESVPNWGHDRAVTFLMSKGDGTFSEIAFRIVNQAYKPMPATHIYTHHRFSTQFEVRTADVNGDGRPDLINWEKHGWNDQSWDVSIFLNMGRRTSGDVGMMFREAIDDDGRAWANSYFPMVAGSARAGWESGWGTNIAISWLTELYYDDFDGDGSVDFLRREVGSWVDGASDTDSNLLYNENGATWNACQPREIGLNLTGPTNHGGAWTSTTSQTANMVLVGDTDGDSKAEVLSWRLGTDRTLRVYSPGRNRGTLETKTSGITLPAASSLHNVLLADINGDGRKELILVRNASGLPMQVYQAGQWYEEALNRDPARGIHGTNQPVETVVTGGRPVLFKRHAEAGKSDGNLAWTTTRADGSWLPWQSVLLADQKPYALLDRSFVVVDDGLRLSVIQRSAPDQFKVLRLLFRAGGGTVEPSIEQYQEVVFNGSGTSTPMRKPDGTPDEDDTLVARPEQPWTFTVSSYFTANVQTGTPSQNLQDDEVARAIAASRYKTGDAATWFDATFVPGGGGQRLVMAVPAEPTGYYLVSLRTVDGKPAPRGLAANDTERAPQFYNRPDMVRTDGTLVQPVVPDGAASYIFLPSGLRPSVAALWNQSVTASTTPGMPDTVMRTSLALKLATVHAQPTGTFTTTILQPRLGWPPLLTALMRSATLTPTMESVVNLQHIPLDEYGIPAAVHDLRGSALPLNRYTEPYTATVPYLSTFRMPGATYTAPRLYQGIDGLAHVLIGRTDADPARDTGVLEAMASTVVPTSIPTNRIIDTWTGVSYQPALVGHAGVWNERALFATPAQQRSSVQPSVVEFATSRVDSRGRPKGAMWRSLVGVMGTGVYVTKPKKLTSLDVQGMGFALINPQIVGVIESAPPLPPAMVTAGGSTSLTFESMASADYQISSASQGAVRTSVDGKLGAFAFNIEAGGGKGTTGTWGLTTGSLEAVSVQSVNRTLDATTQTKAMRQLGQVVFLGDKAAIQALLIPGTGRVVGISLTPIPGQTLTRVYPFGLRTGYLNYANWHNGQAPGYVLSTTRMNEEVKWTNDLQAARKRTLTLTGDARGTMQGRMAGDEEMLRRIDLGGLRNTYQWTAYGGFRAATEERSNRAAYDFTSFGDVSAMVGFSAEGSFGAGLGAMFVKKLFEITVLAGFAGEWSDTKTETKEAGRGMEVSIDIDTKDYLDRVLAQAQAAAAAENSDTALRDAPIDAIEFTTFYLPKSGQNFADFYGKVLSSAWLRDPRAPGTTAPAIIRDAQQNLRDNLSRPREIWRIAHRVTMVSRLYREIATSTEELQ